MGFRLERTGPEAGSTPPARRGGLCRLARDRSANVIAIMTLALIPLAGLIGSAVDMSRLYLTKTRLQQACDAGALAGRKVMGAGTWSANSGAANAAAQKFFDANFKWDTTTQKGAYGSLTVARSFSESGGKVTGTASAQVPMTVMKIFRQSQKPISVTCDAEMRLPNTDIMFVLDNTGSMDFASSSTDSTMRITALRKAVKCFYETVAKYNTTADCGSTPSGGVGGQVQIRFGFVPYATNVNVGRLLPTSYFANTWTYQSRKANFVDEQYVIDYTTGTTTQTGTTTTIDSSWSGWTEYYEYTGWCNSSQEPADNTTYASEGTPQNLQTTTLANGNRRTTWYTNQGYTDWQYQQVQRGNNNNNRRCEVQRQQKDHNTRRYYERIDTANWGTRTVFDSYDYGPIAQNVSGLKNGTSWNTTLTLPVGDEGTNLTMTWSGCIEERSTVRTTNFNPIPAGAKDLDIDLVPNQGDSTTLWGPALRQLVFLRNGYNSEIGTDTDYSAYPSGSFYCPREARLLQEWTTSNFETYVDSLTTDGNTYHDIGLLWGGRLMSPTGIFASQNAFTPQGGEIERHLVFMTDGDTNASPTDYRAYGYATWDRRQTSVSSAPTQAQLEEQVDLRTQAICRAIRNKNITVWVVVFGDDISTTTETNMRNCATSATNYFRATDSAALNAAFASIAAQISQLRLTQ
jgi:Flp pilus assembly protein TadG